VLEDFLSIADHFEQLARNLAALKAFYSENPKCVTCLESAERGAMRGVELARSQVSVMTGNSVADFYSANFSFRTIDSTRLDGSTSSFGPD